MAKVPTAFGPTQMVNCMSDSQCAINPVRNQFDPDELESARRVDLIDTNLIDCCLLYLGRQGWLLNQTWACQRNGFMGRYVNLLAIASARFGTEHLIQTIDSNFYRP